MIRKLMCTVLGHRYESYYDPYAYGDIHIQECERCGRVKIIEWSQND